jgi:O-antigen/teichoic acid export membrane protein
LVFRRFIIAIGGSAGVALSGFILSILLLRTVTPAQFGVYGFIQVVIALGFGISNALFGSPLTVALNRTETPKSGTAESYFKASFLISLLSSLSLVPLAISFGESPEIGAAFSASAMLMWTRWIGRSYANAIHQHRRVAVSDACYTVITLLGAATLFVLNEVSIKHVVSLQSLGTGLGLLALGFKSLVVQLRGIWNGPSAPFRQGFKEQGRHALLGVITTEATANVHSYMVTLMLGPAAFAPLAASVLLFRPVPLVILSLTQLERPRIAQLLRDTQLKAAWRAIRFFRGTVLTFWIFNLAIIYWIVTHYLDVVIRGHYDAKVIIQATYFWAAIMGLRCLRGPESALLQANGDFKPLARVTVISSLVTIPLVATLVYLYGAIWSLAGILTGEVLATALTRSLARKQISHRKVAV